MDQSFVNDLKLSQVPDHIISLLEENEILNYESLVLFDPHDFDDDNNFLNSKCLSDYLTRKRTSQVIRSSIACSSPETDSKNPDFNKSVREFYLSIANKIQIKDIIIYDIIKHYISSKPNNFSYNLTTKLYNGESKKFTFQKSYIFIGRRIDSDVVIKDDSVSRINTVIFTNDEYVYICDLWSIGGTTIIHKDGNIEKTYEGNRKIIKVKVGEPFTISMGKICNSSTKILQDSNFIYFSDSFDDYNDNNNKCCICLENLSSIRFEPCGHGAVCHSCFDQNRLLNCPICRASISQYKESLCINEFKTII